MSATMRAGAVAEAADVNVQTLRYYERRGLLASPERSLGGHRLYPPQTVTRLRLIKTAQRLGFTLTEVADLLETGGRHHTDNRLQARTQTKLTEIEQKIADLQAIRTTLSEAQAAGCDDLTTCATTPKCPLPFGGHGQDNTDAGCC